MGGIALLGQRRAGRQCQEQGDREGRQAVKGGGSVWCRIAIMVSLRAAWPPGGSSCWDGNSTIGGRMAKKGGGGGDSPPFSKG